MLPRIRVWYPTRTPRRQPPPTKLTKSTSRFKERLASYYFESKDKLKALKVVDPKTKQANELTAENIERSIYSPLGRPLFIYVSATSVKRPELRKFVEYYIDHAEAICRRAKCVPLTTELYKTVRQRFDDRVEGSYFYDEEGKSRVGSLSEIYVEKNLTQPK